MERGTMRLEEKVKEGGIEEKTQYPLIFAIVCNSDQHVKNKL